MKRFTRFYLCALALAIAGSSYAADFSQADKFFAQRENNPSAIASARALYQQVLDTSSDKTELMYAMNQLGRLDYYEGDLLTPESDSDKRMAIFQHCIDNADKISPEKLGDSGMYYYWKTSCTALWGKSASKWTVFWSGALDKIKTYMNKGLTVDPNFDNGGMHRVVATIQIRSPGYTGLGNTAEALKHIDAAIALGPQFYNCYIVKAEILKALGRDDEGIQLLESTKRTIEGMARANKLPAGLEPETKVYLRQITAVLASN